MTDESGYGATGHGEPGPAGGAREDGGTVSGGPVSEGAGAGAGAHGAGGPSGPAYGPGGGRAAGADADPGTAAGGAGPLAAAPPRSDVLVVGAGPTGLLLAGDLAAAGLTVTVVERRRPGISNLSRAFSVHARTLEELDARGLADALVATGHPLDHLQLFGRLALDLGELRTRFPYVLVTPQYEVERLLERRAREAGVHFVFDAEVTGLRQDGTGVEVDLRTGVRARTGDGFGPAPAAGRDGDTGAAHGTGREARVAGTLRAAYLVGSDGHHSSVRGALGLPFPGETVITSILLADVRLKEEPPDLLTVNGNGEVFAFLASFGDGWHRVMAWDRHNQRPDTDPADLEEVRGITARAFGTDFGMHDARWISRFHSEERQVPAYRVGRVFLAGDAAHVHSPAGGQGMNTGLQDAANLSWKLAAVLRGRAPGSLLDSYHDERHPVGKQVLRSSGGIVRLAMAHTPVQRGLRGALGLTVSRVGPLHRALTKQVSGVGIRYATEPGAHSLAGHRVPDLRLRPAAEDPEGAVGSGSADRLYEALRAGEFVLVAPAEEVRRHVAAVHGRPVRVVAWAGDRRTLLLVRPDGYAAWATDEADPARRSADLGTALARWTGPARLPVPAPSPAPARSAGTAAPTGVPAPSPAEEVGDTDAARDTAPDAATGTAPDAATGTADGSPAA
jgi:2-polyprenyl-6-methoxyphenol hydroxylase-like FAD-dependent oxidoreductase